jgi:hypothetical protein
VEVEQRFLPKSIAGQHQFAGIAIEEAKRPHAIKNVDAVKMASVDEFEEELCIACRPIRLVAKNGSVFEVSIIVDLAIVDERAVAFRERLM